MAETQQSPSGVDTSKPSVARIYDYLLGGVNNFPVDQAAAELMKSRAPELVDGAFANRGFHQRAAKWIAEQGVRQFIDLGSGLPTIGNTHEVVRKVHPDAHVVYVDNDPMVQIYGSHLLAGDDAAAVVLADLRDPDSVLGSEAARRLIDFREPAAYDDRRAALRVRRGRPRFARGALRRSAGGRELHRTLAHDGRPQAAEGGRGHE